MIHLNNYKCYVCGSLLSDEEMDRGTGECDVCNFEMRFDDCELTKDEVESLSPKLVNQYLTNCKEENERSPEFMIDALNPLG